MRLQQLASEFIRLEELVAEKQESNASQIIRIGLLDGKVSERRAVISLPPERASSVDELAKQITLLLEDYNQNNKAEYNRVRLAALAKVADRYLRLDGENTHE
jgi:hypothetical protein